MKIGLWRIKGYLFIYSLHRYLLPEKFPGDECHQPKVTKMTKAVTCFTFSGSGSTLFPLSYKTPQIQLLHREWLFKTIVCLSGLLHLWGDSHCDSVLHMGNLNLTEVRILTGQRLPSQRAALKVFRVGGAVSPLWVVGIDQMTCRQISAFLGKRTQQCPEPRENPTSWLRVTGICLN